MPGPNTAAVDAALWPFEAKVAWLLENAALWLSYVDAAGAQRAIDVTDQARVLVVVLPEADGQMADAPATLTTLRSCDGYCRVCGCSQVNACVTDTGACHWVEPDLCSACVGAAAALPTPAAWASPAAADRELLAARQLVRLLRDTLIDRGEHTGACERALASGAERCTCGLDEAIGLAVAAEPLPPPPVRTPAEIDAWVAERVAETDAWFAQRTAEGAP